MEIEAKYGLAGVEDLERIALLRSIAGYELRPRPAVEQQNNRYYDTAGGTLEAARYGLRLRRVGARSLVTLKGPASVSAGVHRRAEWEFEHTSPNPHSWPAGEARSVALSLIGDEPLLCTLYIETERRMLDAIRNGQAVVELCLDQGRIHAGGREAPICELELELLAGGDLNDLSILATALGEQISLVPESRSKLERGLALLRSDDNEH